MPLRPILRLLLAGLVAGAALLMPVPVTPNPSFDPGPLTLDPLTIRATEVWRL